MQEFPYHTPDTAPEAARPMLEDAGRQYGMVPNLYAKMAEAPALLEAYLQVSAIFARSSLSTTEQQVVLLAASRTNQCGYCMGAHSVLADMAEVPVETTDAIRDDRPIPDPRLEALRRFTNQLVERRGWLDDAEVQTFLDAGFTRENLLDVIVGVGQKTLSNYTNHIAGTELDSAFAHRSWKAPA
ncbi:carboxymuconolactone decarboxylase family protein [Thioalkalivibrio sp.]|uniref:carboxymuconolactone decarboxylase family protein n=1 Tax=Thioalkalivibrio sp. TaxID=2093813 RepID=UPI00356862C4